MTITQRQLEFLHELKALDDLQLGCLAVSAKWNRTLADWVEQQCIERGYVRAEPYPEPWGRVLYLTTRGLRAWQRYQAVRFQPHLALGVAA